MTRSVPDDRGPEAMRGVPQSGLWSEEEIASSGTGSERAKVASVAGAEAPREPGSLGAGQGHSPNRWGVSRVNGVERNRQRAGEDRERLITDPTGLQRSVPEEAVHREG